MFRTCKTIWENKGFPKTELSSCLSRNCFIRFSSNPLRTIGTIYWNVVQINADLHPDFYVKINLFENLRHTLWDYLTTNPKGTFQAFCVHPPLAPLGVRTKTRRSGNVITDSLLVFDESNARSWSFWKTRWTKLSEVCITLYKNRSIFLHYSTVGISRTLFRCSRPRLTI